MSIQQTDISEIVIAIASQLAKLDHNSRSTISPDAAALLSSAVSAIAASQEATDLNNYEYSVVDMNDVDYVMTPEEAQTGFFFVVHSGDGTKVLTNPDDQTKRTPLKQWMVTGFGGAAFYYGSSIGGSPRLLSSRFNDMLGYLPGMGPFSLYDSFTLADEYGPTWENSKQYPTAGALYNIIQTLIP